MTKFEARQYFKEQRSTYSDLFLAQSALKVSQKVQKMSLGHFSYFHTYLPIPTLKELPTQPLIDHLWSLGKQVLIPKVVNSTSMSHHTFLPDTNLTLNHWNIREPVSSLAVDPKNIDVVFLPMLGFDLMGNRVGYGKGFYDRFLSECKSDVLKIGLCCASPIRLVEDVGLHDQPLDYAITPEKIYKF